MEELSSQVLNVQIISMRKEVKKAIVHLVHALTQKINLLRIKKGTEEQKAKNEAKADSLVSEIQVLKKLKADSVSLFALSNVEENYLNSLIAKPIISSETKAMVKVCLRKNMRIVVLEFTNKYKDDSDKLMDLINDRYANENPERKKSKKKKKKKKGTKQISNSKGNSASQKLIHMSESNESIPQVIPADSSKTKIMSHESSDESDVQNNSEPDITSQIDSDSSDNEDLLSPNFSVEKENMNEVISTLENSQVKLSKGKKGEYSKGNKSGTEPKEINTCDEEDKQIISKVYQVPRTERKKVDPFFKTSDDSDYMTYCDIKEKLSNDKEENSKQENTFEKVPLNKSKGSDSFQNKFDNKKSFNRNPNGGISFKRNTNDWKPGFKDTRDRGLPYKKGRFNNMGQGNRANHKNASETVGTNENIKLHPSWEAKRKLNIAAVPFQGKKITFDD